MLEVGGAGALEQRLGGVVGEDAALAHQDQPLAAARLVHHMRGHQQGGAALVAQAVEDRPELLAEHWVEADGGLVEDEQLRGPEQGDGEVRPRELTAAEAAGELVALADQRDLLDHPLRIAGRRAEHAREVSEVLEHAEVGVERRRLGRVADAAAQRCAPRGQAEDGDGAAGDLLHPDDGAEQGGLAAAAGAEQPRHGAAGDAHVEVGEHLAPAADHTQVLDRDRRR